MSEEGLAAIGLLEDPGAKLDDKSRQLAFTFCQSVRTVAAHKGLAAVDQVVARLKKGAETPHLAKRLLIRSTLADITGEAVWYDRLFDDLMADGFGFDRRHTLMVHLATALFLNRAKIDEAEYERLEQVRLRALFARVVADADAILARSSFASAPMEPVQDRVVILTPQFLRAPHATTVRALEYAGALIEDFGKTPVIVEAHVAYQASPFAFVPSVLSQINPQLGALDRVAVGPHSVEYYRIASPYFSQQDLVAVAGLLSALSPELVIAISTPFVAAEVAALRFPTFSQPTTASLPITARAKSFSWRPPTDAQRAMLADAGAGEICRFDMHPGFSAPETAGPADRAALKLPKDAFLFAVVGNRLDIEVDGGFLDLLEEICADPRAGVVMMGTYSKLPTTVAARSKLKGRVHFIGFQEDVLAALGACDAFLNPDRTGGGRSGAYAMHAGLPVLSLPRGDVASTVGEALCQPTYADIAAEARRLMNDDAYRLEKSAAAKARSRDVIGVRPLVERILAEMLPEGAARASAS